MEELANAADAEKPGCLVVGEIPCYPKDWFPSADGLMNFALRDVTVETANERISAQLAQRMIECLAGGCSSYKRVK